MKEKSENPFLFGKSFLNLHRQTLKVGATR
jgi:hypothetical protein